MAIIKPDAVVHGKAGEIIMKVRETTPTPQSVLALLWWKNRWGIVHHVLPGGKRKL